MAKKKKPTRGKAKVAARQPSPFLQYAGAVLLILIALFILMGGLHTGGTLPMKLFGAAKSAFGGAAYLLPIALVYWGVVKFARDSHKMPFAKLLCLFLALCLAAGFMHVVSATKGTDPATGVVAWMHGQGGAIGQGLGGLLLGALNKFLAAIVCIVAFVPAVFYAFSIPFEHLMNLAGSFKPEPNDPRLPKPAQSASGDMVALNRRGGPVEEEPKMSRRERRAAAAEARATEKAAKDASKADGLLALQVSGMGTDPAPEETSAKRGGLKNSGNRLAPAAGSAAAASQDALTLASDPNWQIPSLSLLNQKEEKPNGGDVNAKASTIHSTFANFNIDVEMIGANIGPRVTQYTLKPPSNVKLTKITALENNLALDLAAHSIRMEAPIPGQQAVGIEVPNEKAATVPVASLLRSKAWLENRDKPLSFVIGRDIANNPIVQDLAKMPHLLVAGQTGSGKSVMINTLLTSLLYHNSPSDMKLILVDPKQVEMAPYNDIPHLLTPVINEPEKCISALKWAVAEMERRLRAMAEVGKRNIGEYNNLKKEEGMPYIVIVIDELADLMMMAARDVEALIVRLAQKARAAGIHLVLATQRPSVDVITGLIKANVPARIAFTVASQVDSRTIIDQMGAEKLLGMGDMLLLTSGMNKPKRIQAAFISDDETGKITDFLKLQRPPSYDMEIVSQPVQIGKGGVVQEVGSGSSGADEDMFRDAVKVVIENKKASTSLLQRRLRIGYGRAARMMEEMEEQGIIGAADGARPREVLVSSLEQVFGGGDSSAADDSDAFADAAPSRNNTLVQ